MIRKDIERVNKSFKKKNGIRNDKIYKFTTENISGYINQFHLKNGSLLTVGSSGDQAINANFYGCNYVTVVDLNRYTKYYFYLKKAALLTLSYDEFLNYFSFNNNYRMSKTIYEKIREKLRIINIDSLIFWDYIYDCFDINKKSNNLFHDYSDELINVNIFNTYLNNENNYNLEKEKINNLNIKFINGDILKSDKIFTWEKFDNINLSNIYSYNYEDNKYKLMKFKKGVKKLVDRLNDDGVMLVSYLYGTSHNSSLVDFASNDVLDDIVYSHFKGVRGIYKNNNITDTAVIYQKKITK